VKSSFYGGARSTARSFLREAPQYRHLQVSAHALGQQSQLNNNFLYFGSEDSLNGVEIGTLQLRARTVFLAACSTGTGFRGKREGTFSLRRSFHRAGAAYVVASLYNLPAAATAQLLEDLYHHLEEGVPLARAVAMVQRDCLRGRYRSSWRHPFYWGGIVLG
jgi:CHAT domain-containing protein